jgi:cold shock protein
MRGKVKFWNGERGWGFLVADSPAENDVFVHATALVRPLSNLIDGQEVEFDIVNNPRREGRTLASNVRLV